MNTSAATREKQKLTPEDHDELYHLFCVGCGLRNGKAYRARCGKTKEEWHDGNPGPFEVCQVCVDLNKLPVCPECGRVPKFRFHG